MTDLHEAIRRRRSIRKYHQKPVSREMILAVLGEAGWAPSAHNSQPWRFIIVENPSVKQELAQKMTQAWAADLVHEGYSVDQKRQEERVSRFADASALIVVCMSMEGLRKFSNAERQKTERDLAVESLGAALQTLLLAAYDTGLGACWYCTPAFCKEMVREVLKIPESVEPSAIVTLGYPAESPQSKRKALGEFCYIDVWNKPAT